MNVPNRKTLERIEGITEYQIDMIRAMISGKYDPCEVSDACDRWVSACYGTPGDISQILRAADDLLNTHGVEHIGYADDRVYNHTRFSYCNTGASYAATLCYDYGRGRWVVAGLDDLRGG